MAREASRDVQSTRLAGLDAIRFLCALVVLLGHLAARTGSSPDTLTTKIWRSAFNGQAAVVIFFVISGLCIHLPAAQGRPDVSVSYFVRRYVRICIPVLGAIGWAEITGFGARALMNGVLWSIYAELVYYTLYPLILAASRRVSWPRMIAASLAVAAALYALCAPSGGNLRFFNPLLDWTIGLPAWLIGCFVAERPPRAALRSVTLWLCRCGVLTLSIVVLQLRFRFGIAYGYTLPLFAIVAATWIGRELDYFRARRPWAWLERAGAWSYSLYVTHPSSTFACLGLGLSRSSPWTAHTCLATAYVFALSVEFPSHHWARRLAADLGRRRGTPACPSPAPSSRSG